MRKFLLLMIITVLMGGLMAQESTMPTVTIVTDGPIVNTPAVHGTITVDDHNGTVIVMHAGFKIRGTSSQQYEKKSYRVELWADETGAEMIDTTFLGLRSDDDWNLEAQWNQPLRLRDKVANTLWMEMYQLPYLASQPTALPGIRMRYVDLHLNGEYVGVYALTERMDRKQLELKKYTGKLKGLIVKGNGGGAPTFEALPDYDNTSDTWGNYEWVYPNESDTAINWSPLYNFTNFVMNASNMAFYSQYSTMFDADNAVDYFLFINVIKAMDNMGRNLFVARYKSTTELFYVPWDLDAIMGLDTEGQPTVSADGIMSNGFYDRLLSDCSANGFVTKARDRYNALRETILNREHIMALVQAEYDALLACGAYDHEHEAWPEFTVDAGQLDFMSDWLDARFAYLDVELNAACGTWNEDELAEDQGMEVFPNPTRDQIHVRFAEPTVSLVRLYDMTGREVFSMRGNAQIITIPANMLRSGIYTVLVQLQDRVLTERVIVQ